VPATKMGYNTCGGGSSSSDLCRRAPVAFAALSYLPAGPGAPGRARPQTRRTGQACCALHSDIFGLSVDGGGGGGGAEGCAEEGRRRWLRYLSCRARKDRSPFCIHRVRGGGKMVGVRSAEMGLAHGCGRSAQAQWGPATQKSHERVT
jgi:hypothetical protein